MIFLFLNIVRHGSLFYLWTVLILFHGRPYTFVDLFIPLNFFICGLTSFCVCCFALLSRHFLTQGFIKRNLLTSSFTFFDLVALLFIIHSTFLLWHLLADLYFFCSTLFMWDLSTILNLEEKNHNYLNE